jgi:hypothetical protein
MPDVSSVVRPPLAASLRDDVAALEAGAIAGDSASVIERLFAIAGAVPVGAPGEAPAGEPVVVPEVLAPVVGMSCPRCATGTLHRSKARGPFERLRRVMGDRRLYRCDRCGWRGWREPTETAVAPPVPVGPPPDLSDLDVPPPAPRARRPAFSPRDL